MTHTKNEYQSLGATFARQIDEARLASHQLPPIKDAAALYRAALSLKPRAATSTIAVNGGEVVVLARGGRVVQIVHRAADKNGRMRVAGSVSLDNGDLRSNRPEPWARELVKFTVASMGGAK